MWRHLRCQQKRRKRYGGERDRRGQIVDRRPISEPPAYVEKRRQVGHWEGDTIIDANHKQAIVSLVEVKTGYAFLAKVFQKTSALVCSSIIRWLKGVAPPVKTITYDNRNEFAEHARVDRALQSKGYFAEPFSSWE